MGQALKFTVLGKHWVGLTGAEYWVQGGSLPKEVPFGSTSEWLELFFLLVSLPEGFMSNAL